MKLLRLLQGEVAFSQIIMYLLLLAVAIFLFFWIGKLGQTGETLFERLFG